MPVFLLKIDTDGHNLEVLEGATELLKRTSWIIMEFEDDAHIHLLMNSWNWVGNSSPVDRVYRNLNYSQKTWSLNTN